MTDNTNNTATATATATVDKAPRSKAPRSKAPRSKATLTVAAIGHALGTAIGDALRAKQAAKAAGNAAQAARDAANDAIKRGLQDGVEWPKGNKRTNAMASSIDAAIGKLEGVSDKARANYLSTVKWCYEQGVVLQRWDLNAQKKKAQLCALTGKDKDVEGTGTEAPKCIRGFVAMQESQEGFDAFLTAYAAVIGLKDIELIRENMWHAFRRLGWAKKNEDGEWVAK